MENNWLEKYRKNIHSMNGEDGIIEKSLSLLSESKGETLDRWCVEFGAWDGILNSNTCNLIKNQNYKAVLIEGVEDKFGELKNNFQAYKDIYPHLGYVGASQDDNLDHILEKYPIPKNFDFLSIDIDGNDYYVWQAFHHYKPKLVCIEFNPTIPNEVHFVQKFDMNTNHGTSPKAMVELAKKKGYELITTTRNNAIFVDEKYFHLFQITDNSLEKLRTDKSRITYLFSGYDGTVFVRGFQKLDLHNLPFDEKRMQILPKFLRGYSDTESLSGKPVKKTLGRWYKSLKKRNIL